MSNIDLSQMVSAEEVSATALAVHAERVKSECSRRIHAVAAQHTQMNLTGAAAAGALDAAQMAAYAEAVTWIAGMRAACAVLATDRAADFLDDSAWPSAPADVVALAAAF